MSYISYSEWKKEMKHCVSDIISTSFHHKHGNVFPIVSQVATGGVIINVGFAT